ncbi:Molybdate transporter 2 [Camellia lanceoleosa]|nr:Molybdate transporter 2 [Camellia lanceoleosa]
MEEEEGQQSSTQTIPLLALPRWHQCLTTLPCATNLRLKTTIWSELGGSVGDLNTYISIILALTLVSHLDLSTTLIFTSLYNISTSLLFGTPMPVQLMKSIAAVAISESPYVTIPKIAAAGISTASVLLLFGATGFISFFYLFIRPPPPPTVPNKPISTQLCKLYYKE